MTLVTEARAHFAAAPSSPQASLDFIWQHNLAILHKIIANANDPAEAIQAVNRYAFYDFTCVAPILEPAVRWYGAALFGHGVHFDVWPFDESELIGDDRCVMLEGKRISTDMLYRALTITELTRGRSRAHGLGRDFHIKLSGDVSILEIGGGYGSLARTIMGLNPNAKYVMIDLPETLFFAEVFLRHSFPEKSFAYADERGHDADADIVLVPAALRRVLTGKQFDLAINTNSLGEMPRAEAIDWLTWLASDIRPAKFWSLNRLLNRVDDNHWGNRKGAAGMNFLWPTEWRILDWQVNPAYERCPYYMSIVTRNLHIIADLEPYTVDRERMTDVLDDVACMDFRRKPTWQNYQLVEGNDWPAMAKGWPDLTPDLTMTGALYQIWEARRQGGAVDHLLRDYLEMLNGGAADGFEESRYLEQPR